MPRIPFKSASLSPHDHLDAHDVEQRLRRFLNGLRGDLICSLSDEERIKIKRRTRHYLSWREKMSGLAHLGRSERNRLEAVRHGAELKTISTEHEADEIASTLHCEMPWMAPATEQVWQDLRSSVRRGDAAPRLSPLLLVGPPGIGKSFWARRLAEALSVPACVIEATGEPAGFSVSGTQRGWASAGAGKPLEAILNSGIANPIVVVDEVEKAGLVTSSKGTPYQLADALLPLLEPLTSAAWSCPYFRVKFDMSWIGWVLTANSLQRLPPPLLSRCPPVRLTSLSKGQLAGFARREGERRGLQDDAIGAVEEVIATISKPQLVSLSSVSRMLDNVAAAAARPCFH